jgi:phage baseplate assembly protein V
MSSNRVHDSEKNSPFKRGIVVKTDASKVRAKVRFSDEDGNVSYWLNVNQPASGSNKSYRMPDVGSQVNCLIDWDGEDGTVLGSAYSEADSPPTTDGKHLMEKFDDGTVFKYDRGSSTLTITIGPVNIVVDPSGITVTTPRWDMNKS